MRINYVEERKASRLSLQSGPDDVAVADLRSRQQRAAVFADWIVEEFADELRGLSAAAASSGGETTGRQQRTISDDCGRTAEASASVGGGIRRRAAAAGAQSEIGDDDCISSDGRGRIGGDAVILDVAGGRGDVGFELAVKRHLSRVVIVDPRGQKIRRWQKKLLKSSLCGADIELPEHVARTFDRQFIDDNQALLSSVRLLLGLHPDEATEPLVDAALRLAKPFAVVPCCVFATQNKHRSITRKKHCSDGYGGDNEGHGRAVRTYEDFCEYLLQKKPVGEIRTAHLSFRGRNRVLFWKPTWAAEAELPSLFMNTN